MAGRPHAGSSLRAPTHRSALLRAALLAVLLGLLLAPSVSVVAQGPNLLQNPGFERPYVSLPDKENCRIAAPWVAYWFQGSEQETHDGYRLAPEYKAAFRDDYPGNRVRNGELSQQYFHSYGNFEGGILQQVNNIQVGARLRFEIWGLTWSCDKEAKGNCGGATSGDPSPMHFRIGIDPTGGTDGTSKAIVWSPEQDAYDAWTHFQVEAVAQKAAVTVFVYAYPTYRSQDNNVYVDDASLSVVAPPPTSTPRPTTPPTVTPMPTKTNVPTATPMPTATNPPTAVPPTKTPLPSATAAPTQTPAPTATPTKVPATSLFSSGTGLTAVLAVLAVVVVGLPVAFLLRRRTR